jgi:ribulose-phosphate 3-epimerase
MLASDLADLGREAKSVIAGGADSIHLDCMDGHFVPNLSWGPPVISCLRKSVGKDVFIDCHMMVSNPLQWVKPVKDAGGNQYTFHIEACGTDDSNAASVCAAIRDAGMKVGIAIKPGTPVSAIASFVNLVDMVLVMTVEPGFGGQSFMPNMMPKVLDLRTQHPTLDIQVDGGLGPSTIDAAAKAGANMIVAGSACFKPGLPPSVPITEMRRSVFKYGRGEDMKFTGGSKINAASMMLAAAALVVLFSLQKDRH